MATVSEGRTEVAELLIAGVTGNEFDTIAIGSDGTATTDGMTSLQVEEDRSTGLTGSVTGEVASLNATFTGLTADIQEVGILESTSDTLLARQTIDTVPLGSNDTIDVTFEIDINDA